jgi:hypothetical protein
MEGLGFVIPYLAVLLLMLILLGVGLWWLVKILRAFRTGRKRVAWLNLGAFLLIALPIFWQLELLPLSRNIRFMDQAEELTGQRFWGWRDGGVDEPSVRGEGYWLEFFAYSEEVAKGFMEPDIVFFTHRPQSAWISQRGWHGWKRSPILLRDSLIFEAATPIFGGWSNAKVEAVERLKRWGRTPGCYYAYDGGTGSLNFYMINPHERAMAIVYSNP